MAVNDIWFNGVSARAMGVRNIESYPDLNRAERKIDVFEVPGRSGSVVKVHDAWNNIEKQYEIYSGDGTRNSVQRPFSSIGEWLNSAEGYARLEDTYEPDIFRLAYTTGAFEAENAFTRHGRATLTFNCRPERFLKSGEKEIEVVTNTTATKTLRNPTAYKSKPLLAISSSDGSIGNIVINNDWIFMEQMPGTDTVYIDCETCDAYYYDTEDEEWLSYNYYVRLITGAPFPVLKPGDNTIRTTTNTFTVKITPRWFVI